MRRFLSVLECKPYRKSSSFRCKSLVTHGGFFVTCGRFHVFALVMRPGCFPLALT
ncbi:hypothetical protein M441DRAFT_357794 [Trichoderma asperellum CBS 433.97]|uniref:Uncharacterized protein n=1 Tax=Trichoderma asperellum (strain ATCC 204424 / CBS 433.97 / NBRC 101777) TaxID=1042311 RepID=A0A2T3YQN6_TRIA4|nr:hypothetical protein M441DRAFT_357794 [Trichoderma asperellum CBS 433.97]PTB34836.1 hypothetical protein M441DRAFT_357794 [Trichoderma asperellum CBS 433.97]